MSSVHITKLYNGRAAASAAWQSPHTKQTHKHQKSGEKPQHNLHESQIKPDFVTKPPTMPIPSRQQQQNNRRENRQHGAPDRATVKTTLCLLFGSKIDFLRHTPSCSTALKTLSHAHMPAPCTMHCSIAGALAWSHAFTGGRRQRGQS